MLFQTLDDKSECVGYFSSGKLYFGDLPDSATKTWNYSAHLKDRNIQYAKLYCGGKLLDEACPDHLRDEWTKVSAKLKAHFRSFATAKISLSDHCFFDLVPKQFLLEIKNLMLIPLLYYFYLLAQKKLHLIFPLDFFYTNIIVCKNTDFRSYFDCFFGNFFCS